MKSTKSGVFKPVKTIKTDAATKARLQAVGEVIRGKDVFQKSNKIAETIIKGLKAIPNPSH